MKRASNIFMFILTIVCLVLSLIARDFITTLWIVTCLLWQWNYMKLRDLYESLYGAIIRHLDNSEAIIRNLYGSENKEQNE